jgi:hypothetical protein
LDRNREQFHAGELSSEFDRLNSFRSAIQFLAHFKNLTGFASNSNITCILTVVTNARKSQSLRYSSQIIPFLDRELFREVAAGAFFS